MAQAAVAERVVGPESEVPPPTRRHSIRRPRVRILLTVGLAILIGATVVVPIGALLWESLVDSDTGQVTGAAYASVFGDPRVWEALANTAVVITIAEVIALGIGTALAWLMTSTDMPLKRWLRFIPMGPLLFPPLLSALGWIFLLTPSVGFINIAIRGLTGDDSGEGPFSIFSLLGVGWIIGIYSVPYVYAVVAPAFANLDPRLDEAAKMSGAKPGVRFFTVTLRLLMPSLIGGALFAFIVAASEFTIPLLIGTRANLPFLSTEIYTAVTHFPVRFDEGAALAMGLLVIVAVITVLQRKVTTRRSYVTVGGRGGSRPLVRLGRWRPLAAVLTIGFFVISILLPVLAIVWVSLLPFWRVDSFNTTLSNYHFVIFEQAGSMDALGRSAIIGVVGASLAVAVAMLVVYLTLRNERTRTGAVLEIFAAMPLGVPSIVFGTGALFAFLYSPVPLYGTLSALMIACVANTLPITLRPIAASYVQLDKSLFEAASVSGASEPRVIRTVTLPLLRAGVVSAWGLTFILLLRELPISIMLTTPGNNVISTYLFNLYDSQTFPAVAALAVVVFLVGVLGLILVGILERLATRRSR